MLIIPDEVKALFQTDGVHKNFHVHFPNGDNADLNNEDVVQESVKFTESLCSQTYFKFGLAEASQLEFTAVGIPNILGSTIECAIEIDCTSLGAAWATAHPVDPSLAFLVPQTCNVNTKLYYRVPYGSFVVDSCPRDHSIMAQRKIVAYSDPAEQMKNKPFQAGQFPYGTITINPFLWLEANSISQADMTATTVPPDAARTYGDYTWLFNAYTSAAVRLYGIKGIHRATKEITLTEGKIYALQVDYQEHQFDDYGLAFFEKAYNSLPSGSFVDVFQQYGTPPGTMYTLYLAEFNNNGTMMGATSGGFSPCYFLEIPYEDRHYGTQVFPKLSKFTKPIFIKPNQTFIVDISDLTKLDYIDDVAFDSHFNRNNTTDVILHICMPVAWENAASWYYNTTSTSQAITDWGSAAPFHGQTLVQRTGTITAYTKEIAISPSYPALEITVNNTLKASKIAPFGDYYTYSNAVSGLNLLIGMMELLGAFWKINRDGSASAFDISDNQTSIPVAKSAWEEFWWDENAVDPIGTVGVKFLDDSTGDENVTRFIIGTGKSVYMMEDNEVLKNTTATLSDIELLIDTYFEPVASVINFTPADITLKGLPYLEAGDKVELTADDGEIVNSYILEQTISGIQHLRTEASSTNGELLEVLEE